MRMSRGPLQSNRGCIRRQPVGRVNAAAPGYHYSRDHLLPLKPPQPPPGNQSDRGWALACQATLA